jgi:lauroyl/myristoyl acyltransferase
MDRQAIMIGLQLLKGFTLLIFFYPVRWMAQCLPWRWALKIGVVFGTFHALLIPDQFKRRIQQGIQTMQSAGLPKVALQPLMRRNLVTRYKHLIDSFCYQRLDENLIEQMVPHIEGRPYLDDILAEGKGLILLVSHFGSFGMLIGGLALRGYRLHQIFTLTPQSPYRTWRWVERAIMRAKFRCWTQDRAGWEFWRPGKYLRSLYRKLLEGEILVLYGDGSRGQRFVTTEFMGCALSLPVGPFRIAARAQVALIPAFIIRERDDRHRIVLEKPIVLKDEDQANIHQAANQYAALLAYYVCNYPDHWFTWARLRRDRDKNGPVLELSMGDADFTDFYTVEIPNGT